MADEHYKNDVSYDKSEYSWRETLEESEHPYVEVMPSSKDGTETKSRKRLDLTSGKKVKTSKPKVSVFQRASNEDKVMEPIKGANEEKVSTVTKQNMKEERVEAISTLNVAEKADPIQEQDKEKQISTKDDDSSVAGTEDEEKEQIVTMDEDESEMEDAFPEIMGDGGPDSDDE